MNNALPPKKYTFTEFVAASEHKVTPDEKGYSFDNPNPYWVEMWRNWLSSLSASEHYGDCTKQNVTCQLCLLETLLQDYYKYYFHEEEFRKEDL